MNDHLRLPSYIPAQHSISRKFGHDSIMQCDRVRIVIYQLALKDGDILTQESLNKLWMKLSVRRALSFHRRPPGMSREGRKDIRNGVHEKVRNVCVARLGNLLDVVIRVLRQA